MRSGLLLLALLLVACPDEEPPPPFSTFAGIETLAWDGADGLLATWPDAEPGAGVTYTLYIDTRDREPVAEMAVDGGRAWAPDLGPGEYRARVVAIDARGQLLGEDVSLSQLVGANRLVFRSEVPLPPGFEGAPPGGADVWGEGSTIVVAGLESGHSFVVVDASDVERPEVVAAVSGGGYVKDVKIGDGRLYTNGEPQPGGRHTHPGGTIGARIWDFADPSDPILLSEIGEPTVAAHNLSYGRDHLYLTNNANGTVHIWDVQNPYAPEFLREWAPSDGNVHDQAVLGDLLYVAHWAGFSILDVSQPAAPREEVVHLYGDSACHNIWPTEDGSHVLTTDEQTGGHLRIWDVSDPQNVSQVAAWIASPDASIHNVHVVGDLAYLSYYTEGVIVLDITDPAWPREVGRFDTWLPPPGWDPNNQEPDPECMERCSEGCAEQCEGPDCPEQCDDFCTRECSRFRPFTGAWGVWPFGDHIAVTDTVRGLLLFDFVPATVVRE